MCYSLVPANLRQVSYLVGFKCVAISRWSFSFMAASFLAFVVGPGPSLAQTLTPPVAPRLQKNESLELKQQLSNTLGMPVTVKYSNASLERVVQTLGQMTRLPLSLDVEGLAFEELSPQSRVSLDLPEEISLRTALTLLLESINLDIEVRERTIAVTSKTKARHVELPPESPSGDLSKTKLQAMAVYFADLEAIRQVLDRLYYHQVVYVASDEKANILFVRAMPETLARMRKTLAELDARSSPYRRSSPGSTTGSSNTVESNTPSDKASTAKEDSPATTSPDALVRILADGHLLTVLSGSTTAVRDAIGLLNVPTDSTPGGPEMQILNHEQLGAFSIIGQQDEIRAAAERINAHFATVESN
ncbi:MAG: hypothetical protein KDB22_02385 [Planctomycetales bacterium]|nr:hypothetical protein [Planctomycetales bacterium]